MQHPKNITNKIHNLALTMTDSNVPELQIAGQLLEIFEKEIVDELMIDFKRQNQGEG